VNQTAGFVFLQKNNPEVALVYLLKANRIMPDDAQTLILLSRAEMEIGPYRQALIHWAEAAPVSDSPLNVWRDIVTFTLENPLFLRDYGLSAVRKLLQQNDASAQDYDLAARVYLALEDPLTAEKYWRNAIENFPSSYLSHLHLGIWLVEKGSFKEGLEFIQQAADQNVDIGTSQSARQWLNDR
jgi:tetratricopeptide (TPR) repeat protein